MSLTLLCLTGWLLVSTAAIEKPYYDLEIAEQLFEEFIQTHNKTYEHEQEKLKRYDIFKQNLKRINLLNQFSEVIHGTTQFSDLTEKEFTEKHNSCLPPLDDAQSTCQVVTDAQITTNQAPASLDYRQRNAVSPVKFQNPCNCCWAFATVGSIEGQYALKTGQTPSLSAQQLMDCLQCSGHCARGSFMTSALSELAGQPGVESEEDYPFAHRDLQCQFDKTKAKVQVTGCINYVLKDENKLKEALYQHGPIAVAVDTEGTFHTYNGGIMGVKDCPAGQPGHAVLLVGYGTEEGKGDYWLIKNSWNTNWGEQGYARLARGQNTCGIMNKLAASALIA